MENADGGHVPLPAGLFRGARPKGGDGEEATSVWMSPGEVGDGPDVLQCVPTDEGP